MTKNTMDIPADLPLSKKVLGLRAKWQDAEQRLSEYKAENASYAPRKDVNAFYETTYTYPALTKAKKELAEKEVQAVAAGNPLPDRQKVLGPIEKAIADYPRMVAALKTLAEDAYAEFVAGVKAEMTAMGLREAAECQKARDAWEEAWKAAEKARRALEDHGALFSWCATEGAIDTLPLQDSSGGSKAEYFELSGDGRLTTEAAIELGFQGLSLNRDLVVFPEPVRDEAAEEEAAYWANYKPKHFLADPSNYGDGWEH
ncbi:hypothetical protein ABZ759_02245 [Streptomyces sp. NPDC047860]|uniref:hypothetical protein n=1 Tax=Streptomyces sp. NPDC047860 TaxID=3155743 RepID=UPI0033F46FB9